MKRSRFMLFLLLIVAGGFKSYSVGKVFYITENGLCIHYPSAFSAIPEGGDTIKIMPTRTSRICFSGLRGSADNPIIITNGGGQVHLHAPGYAAIQIDNCKYVKISGGGVDSVHFGFHLTGPAFGLSLGGLSSDCEVEFIEIDSCGLGIDAKTSFYGNPPFPYPVFKNLAIHDNYIHNCCEGMYIGETTSPGMELRHVRVYNNVVMNSGRESIQIANCVEDIEIYNNFGYNSGMNHSAFQCYNCQIGGNTIARVYNNVFIKNPAQAFPVFGRGDVFLYNNYLEDNMGIFSDDRFQSIPGGFLKVENNYFRRMTNGVVADIRNGGFDIYINNNKYSGVPTTFASSAVNKRAIENNNNLKTNVDSLLYSVTNGLFSLNQDCPAQYKGLGPIPGLTHMFNSTPVLDSIPDIYVNMGETTDIPLNISVADNDILEVWAKNLPSCATLKKTNNTSWFLRVDARDVIKNVYFPTILLADSSNNAIVRRSFKLAIKDSMNIPTTLNLPSSLSVEAASKLKLNITGNDVNGDSIRYSFIGLPYFVTISYHGDSAYFNIKPSNINVGSYSIIVRAEDGYSREPAIDTLNLTITPAVLVRDRVLYRVNYGAGVDVEDTPVDWQKDYSDYRSYEANYSRATGSGGVTNEWGIPVHVFGPFRYNGVGMQNILFEYPCRPARYQVNLFFAERSYEVSNNSAGTFGIYLEDSLMQDSVNIFNEVGYKPLRKTFTVDVYDNSLSLKLKCLINMAKLNGIEIKYLEAINLPPVIEDISSQSIREGDTLTVTKSFTDDGFNGVDTLNVKVGDLPSFITINRKGNILSFHCAPGYEDSGVYSIPIHVSDGELIATKSFNLTVTDYHINPPVLTTVNKISIVEGVKDTLIFSYSDPDNDVLTLTMLQMPSFGTFTTTGNGSGRIVMTPGYSSAGNYMIRVKARDSFGFESTDTINLVVSMGYEVVRIPLNVSMITNAIPNTYPQFWVDEQTKDPLQNQHPTGGSWQANPNYLPSQFYIDLGAKYVIKKMYFHDMYNVGTFYTSIGEPNNWTEIFSVYTGAFNSWKLINTDVITRYLNFSIKDKSSPQVNELVIYGYLNPTISANNNNPSAFRIKDGFEIASNNIPRETKVYPTLVSEELNIQSPESKVTTDIYNMQGSLVCKSTDRIIQLGSLAGGIYVVRVYNQSGELLVRSKICKE